MTRLLAALAFLAAACLAAPPASAQATNTTSGTKVSGVTVVAGPGPTVVSTYPASGASIPGGVLILKLTFDQPMAPGAWSYGPSPAGDFPKCLADPRLLADQRTYVLLCSVAESHGFALQINPAPRFASADGRSAKPYTLTFSTTADETLDMHAALQQAGLADTDEPIMTWRDPGQGVSQTPGPAE